MHNYEDFFENHFKSEHRAITLATISCWFLGLIQAIPLLTSWNSTKTSDFNTCSLPILRWDFRKVKDGVLQSGYLPFLSQTWIWIVAVTVFIFPTVIIVVSYSLVIRKLFKESTEASEAFVMISITALYLICWWAICIYLSLNDGKDSRGIYFGLLNSLVNPYFSFLILSLATLTFTWSHFYFLNPDQPNCLHFPQHITEGQGHRPFLVPQILWRKERKKGYTQWVASQLLF